MPALTMYSALVEKMSETAKNHPKSYVVVDGNTMDVLATAMDPHKLAAKVQSQLQGGQVPVIFKMSDKKDILIL